MFGLTDCEPPRHPIYLFTHGGPRDADSGIFARCSVWATYYSNGMNAKGAYDVEIEQGHNLVDAAKSAGVSVFVWSTLDHTPTGAPHWEAKHAVNEYAKQSGLPLVSLYTSCYFENLSKFGMLKFDKAAGKYSLDFAMPTDVPFLCFSVNEVGGWAVAAFRNPSRWIGKDMHALGEYISVREMGKILTSVLGKQVDIPERTAEQFHDTAFKSAMDLELWLNMAIFVDDDKPNTPQQFRDAKLSQEAFPAASTFEQWANKDAKFKAYVAKLNE